MDGATGDCSANKRVETNGQKQQELIIARTNPRSSKVLRPSRKLTRNTALSLVLCHRDLIYRPWHTDFSLLGRWGLLPGVHTYQSLTPFAPPWISCYAELIQYYYLLWLACSTGLLGWHLTHPAPFIPTATALYQPDVQTLPWPPGLSPHRDVS